MRRRITIKMRKLMEAKWNCVLLFVFVLLCISYAQLIQPSVMMDKCKIFFDTYHTANATWVYWDIISKATFVLFLVLGIVNLLAAVGMICKCRVTKKAAYIAFVGDGAALIWLLILTIAENNETLLCFLIKCFTTISGLKYYEPSRFLNALSPVSYFSDRVVVLAVAIVFFVISIFGITKSEYKETESVNMCQVIWFGIVAGVVRFLLALCSKSNMMFEITGIAKNKNQDVISQMNWLKEGYLLYFYFPTMMLLVITALLIIRSKASRRTKIGISAVVLAVNTVAVLGTLLYKLETMKELAIKNSEIFYTNILKNNVQYECLGFLVFDIVSVLLFIYFLENNISFTQLVVAMISIFLISVFDMRMIQDIQFFGIATAVVSAGIFMTMIILKNLKIATFLPPKSLNK